MSTTATTFPALAMPARNLEIEGGQVDERAADALLDLAAELNAAAAALLPETFHVTTARGQLAYNRNGSATEGEWVSTTGTWRKWYGVAYERRARGFSSMTGRGARAAFDAIAEAMVAGLVRTMGTDGVTLHVRAGDAAEALRSLAYQLKDNFRVWATNPVAFAETKTGRVHRTADAEARAVRALARLQAWLLEGEAREVAEAMLAAGFAGTPAELVASVLAATGEPAEPEAGEPAALRRVSCANGDVCVCGECADCTAAEPVELAAGHSWTASASEPAEAGRHAATAAPDTGASGDEYTGAHRAELDRSTHCGCGRRNAGTVRDEYNGTTHHTCAECGAGEADRLTTRDLRPVAFLPYPAERDGDDLLAELTDAALLDELEVRRLEAEDYARRDLHKAARDAAARVSDLAAERDRRPALLVAEANRTAAELGTITSKVPAYLRAAEYHLPRTRRARVAGLRADAASHRANAAELRRVGAHADAAAAIERAEMNDETARLLELAAA